MSAALCYPTDAQSPHLVASTGSTYNCTIAETALRECKDDTSGEESGLPALQRPTHPYLQKLNNFRSVEWSPDGHHLLSSSADNTPRLFTQLPSSPGSLPLSSTTPLPTSPTSYGLIPSSSTPLLLSSPRSLPIRLTSPLSPNPSEIWSSYPLVHPSTETFLSPHSMLASPWDPNLMFLGMERGMGVGTLDLSRNGEGLQDYFGLGTGVAGKRGKGEIVSALACEPESGWLVAGTWGRWIGIYDGRGRGGAVSLFNLKHLEEANGLGHGSGVARVGFTGDGRYLLIRERGSEGMGVWDVRGTGKRLAWLETGEAVGMMKVGFDVWGTEVWAGLGNGWVGIWEGVGSKEGILKSDWGWKAHDDAVSAVSIHPMGTSVATCSGRRAPKHENDGRVHTVDNSIKVWSLSSAENGLLQD